MQLLILAMVLGLLLFDPLMERVRPLLDGWRMMAAMVGPYAALVMIAWARVRRTMRVLNKPKRGAYRALLWTERVMAGARWACLVVFYADLFVLGWGAWLEQQIGDWVLVNDLLTLAPPLGALIAMWWVYYPIDRRLREATLIRQIEDGRPVYPVWTRGQYVLSQVRHQMLLMLGPLLVLMLWYQVVERFVDGRYAQYAAAGGAMCVFLFAPVMIRYLWDTAPLPAGELRHRLMDLCEMYHVRVRQLLLWRTNGGMINGAVMGLVGRLRYILLTDGLIDHLHTSQVEAVMAHELGHVKRHHMPWLLICALSTLIAAGSIADQAMVGVERLLDRAAFDPRPQLVRAGGAMPVDIPVIGEMDRDLILLVGGTGITISLWAWAFGFISRRFERQADTFAVQHLARRHPEPVVDEGRIGPQAITTMTSALAQVAALNHVPPRRKSWRHGSITWRIQYLHTLLGSPIDDCDIDRQVRRIRYACLAMLVVLSAIQFR